MLSVYQKSLELLSSGEFNYNWSEPLTCQLACIVCLAAGIDQEDLESVMTAEAQEDNLPYGGVFETGFWMWSNLFKYSPRDEQGNFKSTLLRALEEAGFDLETILELENLTNKETLKKALFSLGRDYYPEGRYYTELAVVIAYINERVKEMQPYTYTPKQSQPVVQSLAVD